MRFLQNRKLKKQPFAFFANRTSLNWHILVFFVLNLSWFSELMPNKMGKKTAEKNFRYSEQFIKRIKKVVPANISLADEIAGVLEISNDSAYRRLRGETAITLDEAMLLCNHFKINLDTSDSKTQGKVTFVYKSIGNEPDDLEEYLESVLHDFDLLKNAEYIHLSFAAEDIPLFHHLEYEYLTPFKFFYWKKAILGDPQVENEMFNRSLISDKSIALAKKIAATYNQIACTEVWTSNTVESTLSQIKYFWEAGLFETGDDAVRVIDDVLLMIEHIKKQADLGCKFSRYSEKPGADKGSFDLYACEVQIGNNSVFIQADQTKSSYLSFNTFNSLFTFNLEYCLENERWINNLIKKSILISSVSEKQRYQFFKSMISMAQRLRNQILQGE
jgi:hypothetical protein